MANYSFTVSDLNTQIKKEIKMILAQLGNTTADQNVYIYYYMTEVLWELADKIKKKKTSDALIVAANGYVTFQKDGVDIEDLYSPLRILITDESGSEFTQRPSFSAPNGWLRETQNDQIHIKGVGTYVLQYIALPTKITSETQSIDIPQSSYGILKDRVIARIKGSVNDLEGITQAVNMANSKIPTLVDSNKNARMMQD